MLSTTTDRSRPIPEDLLSLPEAARLVPSPRAGRRCHRSTLKRWIFQGELPGYRRGRYWYVSRAELLAYVGPVRADVPLRPEAMARAEASQRARQTDQELRKAGVRK